MKTYNGEWGQKEGALFLGEHEGIRLLGEGTVWDDIRVPLETSSTDGLNAPKRVRFQNVPGTPSIYNALSCLSQTAGVVTIPFDSSYHSENSYTLDFWYYHDQDTLDWHNIYSQQGSCRIRHTSSNKITLWTDIGYTSSNTNTLTPGAWHHICMTYTANGSGGDEFVLYVNGVVVVTQNGWGETSQPTTDLKLNDGSTIMKFDSFARFNYAFTNTEVQAAYNLGNGVEYAPSKTGLVGYWEMDEVSGSTVSDSTSTANDGTVSGTEDTDFEWIPGVVAGTSGSVGVMAWQFDKDVQNNVYFSVQVPHGWREGSPLEAHIHWAGASTQLDSRPMFELEYTVATAGEVFTANTVARPVDVGYTSSDVIEHSHQITEICHIDMEDRTISSMVMCRLSRIPDAVEDTYDDHVYILEVDFHYEKDTMGSNAQWNKLGLD